MGKVKKPLSHEAWPLERGGEGGVGIGGMVTPPDVHGHALHNPT